MSTLKAALILFLVWLFVASPSLYVITDIYLHPEKEDSYRLSINCIGGGCTSIAFQEKVRERVLSDGNMSRLNSVKIDWEKRVRVLNKKLDEIKDSREREAIISQEFMEIRNPELKYTLKSIGISFFLGVLTSLVASFIFYFVFARRKRR